MAAEVKLEEPQVPHSKDFFEPKKDNPWDIHSIYDLQYFCCPDCNYRSQVKQDMVNHAFENHPNSINSLVNIQDGSLCDIVCPWGDDENEIKEEDEGVEEGFNVDAVMDDFDFDPPNGSEAGSEYFPSEDDLILESKPKKILEPKPKKTRKRKALTASVGNTEDSVEKVDGEEDKKAVARTNKCTLCDWNGVGLKGKAIL